MMFRWLHVISLTDGIKNCPNLKMMVNMESSKHHSLLWSLISILNCFSKTSVIRIIIIIVIIIIITIGKEELFNNKK